MMSNWKFFIARRIYRSREGEKEVSKPAVRIAMAGIAIGLAVMIVSVAVVSRLSTEKNVPQCVERSCTDWIRIMNFDFPTKTKRFN